MAEALAAVGLASSIITFIDFSIEFRKLVRSISQSQGSLPKELEECHEYISIVAVWLEDVKRSIPPASTTVEEDRHLEEAIQRCSQTAKELLVLLESLSRGFVPDKDVSRELVHRTRGALGSIKRAGKIMWKRENIKEIRDTLRTNRDDVHLHITSRTSCQVTKLLYCFLTPDSDSFIGLRLELREGQFQLGGSIQLINTKIVNAIGHFQRLQFQNEQLVMQNHMLMQKVDFLCDIVATMERDRRNILLYILDYIPQEPLLASIMSGMEFAVSTIYEARPSIFDRHSRQRVGGREMILQLSNKPSTSEDALSIQVIVKARGAPGSQSVAVLNFKRADFRNASTLSKALRGGHEPVEKFLAFRSTQITFVRFCHNNGNLSILESRGSEVHSDSDLAAVPDSLYFWKILPPLKMLFLEDISGPLHGGAVANHCSTSPEEWEWGVYIERVRAPWAINFFFICLVAGVHRIAALILQHSGHIDDAVEFSLLQTMTALSILIFSCDEFLFVLEWIHTCVSNYMPFIGQDALSDWSLSTPLRIPDVLPGRISTAIEETALNTTSIEQQILFLSITTLLLLVISFVEAIYIIAELNVFVALQTLTLALPFVITLRLMETEIFRERDFISKWVLANIISVPSLFFRIGIMSFTSGP